MQITLNGLERTFPDPQTVQTLLNEAGHAGRRVAVEVNRQIVPRSQHEAYPVVDGDRVEFIQAIGGG